MTIPETTARESSVSMNGPESALASMTAGSPARSSRALQATGALDAHRSRARCPRPRMSDPCRCAAVVARPVRTAPTVARNDESDRYYHMSRESHDEAHHRPKVIEMRLMTRPSGRTWAVSSGSAANSSQAVRPTRVRVRAPAGR